MRPGSLLHNLGWPVAIGLLIALLALLVFPELRPGPVGRPGAAPATSYSEAVDRALPAVVSIYTRRMSEQRHPLADHPFYRHFLRNSPQRERQQTALGSGVIVDPDGYLLTNAHVIRDADEIRVLLYDGRETRAEVVGTDPASDLAVLKVDLEQLTAIEVSQPNRAEVGDVVLAIGNPFGVGQTVTQGILSATGRFNLNLSEYENFLQTDAAINVGNSGGALIDTRGRLLGINTAIYGEGETNVGISFAIPADSAMQVMREIVEHGRVVRGWLGLEVRPLTPARREQLGLVDGPEGVQVMDIYPDSPAERAGLQSGDILTHIDGEAVGENGRRGMNRIVATAPGTEVNLRVLREGEPVELTARIGERSPRTLEQ